MSARYKGAEGGHWQRLKAYAAASITAIIPRLTPYTLSVKKVVVIHMRRGYVDFVDALRVFIDESAERPRAA
jgi:hypothetical protein